MISSDPKQTPKIVRTLREVSDVRALHAVNGVYDLVAMISADSTRSLDRTLDLIGGLEGIEKTVSSIILSTKFERSAV